MVTLPFRRGIAGVVPRRGSERFLALAQLTNSVGDGAFLVTFALYFTRLIGITPTRFGLGVSIGWIAGLVAGTPLGHLADRRGPRNVAALLALATAAAVAAMLFARSYGTFVAAVCVYATCQSGLYAARQALLAQVVEPARRTTVRAQLQSTANAGLGLGAAIGGAALYAGTPAAYVAVLVLDATAFVVAAVLLRRLPAVPPPAPRAAGDGGGRAVLTDRPYAVITLLNAVLLLYMPLLSWVLPLWVARRTAAPTWIVAAVLMLNTVAVMAGQMRVARTVTDLTTATRAVRRAGLVMLGACAVFALSAAPAPGWAAVAALVVGVALQVTAEMMQAAGTWQISFDLAPPQRHGQYQGFFGSAVALARIVGPVSLTALLVGWGAAGWLAFGGALLLAAFAMTPVVRWAERRRPDPHATPTPGIRIRCS